MNELIKNIILGRQTMVSLDEYFGVDFDEQKDRIKKVTELFIGRAKKELECHRIDEVNIDSYINNYENYIKKQSLATRYIFGENVPLTSIQVEISLLFGSPAKLDDVEDMFSDLEDDQKEITKITDFQLGTYRDFPELLERDINFGIITSEQAEQIKSQINGSNESVEVGKTLTKAKPGYKKEIELGFIEPILLSLVVSSIGLLYVGYLYLVV